MSGANIGHRWLRRKRMFSGRLLSTSVSAKYFGSRRCPKSSLSGMKARADPRAPNNTLFVSGSVDNLESREF